MIAVPPERVPARLHPHDMALGWLIPAAIGLLVTAGLLADALWARGVSLRWAAPFLRGEAPPVLTIGASAILAGGLLAMTVARGWLPRREFALIALLFVPTQLVGFNVANIEPLKIALLIVSAFWLVDALGNHRTVRLYVPQLLIWLVILAFAVTSIVNGLLTSVIAQYSILAKFLMFFIVANIVRTPAQLLFAVRLLVGLGILSAILALIQVALHYFFDIALSLEDNATRYWFKETPLGWMIRATALHPTAQNLSHFLLMALALLMLGPFDPRTRLLGGLLMASGVFFTFTGNGLVVMAFLALAAPIVHRPQRTLHYLGAATLSFLVAFQTGALGWLYEHYLLPISGKSAEDRIGLLQTGLEVAERYPLLGIGLNNFGRMAPQPVHNAYMQMVTEIGIIPGIALCTILLLTLVRLLVGLSSTQDASMRQAGKGVFLALLGLSFHFLFEPFINSLVSWSIIGFAEAAALLLCAPSTGAAPVRSWRLAPSGGRAP